MFSAGRSLGRDIDSPQTVDKDVARALQGSLQGEKVGVGHSCCLESCRQTLGQSFNLH